MHIRFKCTARTHLKKYCFSRALTLICILAFKFFTVVQLLNSSQNNDLEILLITQHPHLLKAIKFLL